MARQALSTLAVLVLLWRDSCQNNLWEKSSVSAHGFRVSQSITEEEDALGSDCICNSGSERSRLLTWLWPSEQITGLEPRQVRPSDDCPSDLLLPARPHLLKAPQPSQW